MAWIRTTELLQSSKVTAGKKGETTGERIFRVEYDDLLGAGIDAVLRTSIHRGDPFVDKAGRVDYRLLTDGVGSAAEDPDSSLAWLVTFSYSSDWWDAVERGLGSGGVGKTTSPPTSQSGGGSPSEENSPLNPINRPWVIRVDTVAGDKEAMRFDRRFPTVPVVNSAGDRLTPTPELEHTITVWTIERNVPLPTIFQAKRWEALKNTVNDLPFLDRPRGTVKCAGVNWSSEIENGFPYAKQICVFEIKRPPGPPYPVIANQGAAFTADESITWQLIVLDVGFNDINAVTGKMQAILDPTTGHNIERPLDGAGHRLTQAQINAGSYKFLLFWRYDFVDYDNELDFS